LKSQRQPEVAESKKRSKGGEEAPPKMDEEAPPTNEEAPPTLEEAPPVRKALGARGTLPWASATMRGPRPAVEREGTLPLPPSRG
jgi:hypothetical protein